MGRPPEAQSAISAAMEIMREDRPINVPLSPTTLELMRRDLENTIPNPDTHSKELGLSPIFDPENGINMLVGKIGPAALDASITNQEIPVSLTGREVDLLTEILVPYLPDEKGEWIEARKAGLVAVHQTKSSFQTSEELAAFEQHATFLTTIQMGMREDAMRDLHASYKQAGGRIRQSFIDRARLFEATDSK